MRLWVRLSAAIAGTAAFGALTLGYAVHKATERNRLANGRQLIDQRLQLAAEAYLEQGGTPFGVTVDDPGVPPELAEAARAGNRATYLQETDDGPLLWAATVVDGEMLSVRSSYQAERDALRELDQTLTLAGLVTVGGASLLGVLLAVGMSRRLGATARTARRIAEGELDARVRDTIGTRGRDEVAELGTAIDAMAAALHDRLEAERRVTADIAHELRTPVTGLVTAAELLPPGRPTELVRDRVRVMRRLVEDVLEVARLDAGAESVEAEEVLLSEVVRGAVAESTEPGGEPASSLTVERDAVVSTDPRRVRRILTNLLANAHRHGAPPVEVRVVGATVEVRDHGPGFPEELLELGPQRFRTGARERGRGHGLGLTIASGQAAVLGARLTLANAPDGGGLAVLDLQPRPAERPG
ncbi:Signal transduction histidine kinase [Streptoalloteichus tenebrarius]|uniref:histidine kinase n=1 Tax=Streptoalloteichus tenebrarius (strain ATCC 17920 / DSM 40477 / JCM 4838 / CBS 697.72 / NBRC 16177 / NCIMB 11028 / NRRL B-12390 / A12253. 1 / ISP 5477) TaxID=1933 RepID=A0ABT1HXR6_STRSD|nr:HAMP domain-containing sensor histidine kinase [Streptoalloteichus tenebrarius]MCP2260323.1 Signal transduction histidine kinase [Streptoalloteichus tenebrarius]